MLFRFVTAGESHGPGLTALVEGLPAGLEVRAEDINRDLARRQLGHGRGGRMKIENDRAEVTAGIRHGRTLGSPVALRIENRDYANWKERMSRSSAITTYATCWSAPARGRPPRGSRPAPWPRRSCASWG
jgi:chorismate synthase